MSAPERQPAGGTSQLYRCIEQLHGALPWGAVLDAGTGTGSIRWISTLATDRWTAVTGAEGHAIQVRDTIEPHRRPGDRILLANWTDPALLAGEQYDVVLADYLLGAIEGFAPYFQTELFERLRPLARRRLYVTGVDPYTIDCPATDGGRLIWEIGRFRDACLLLAGDMPYREYPAEWVIRHLQRAGFRVLAAKRFPNRYHARFADQQIDMGLMRLADMPDRELAAVLRARGEALRHAALTRIAADGGILYGNDYLIAAEPV